MTTMCGCNCCKRWNAFADKHYRPLIAENSRLNALLNNPPRLRKHIENKMQEERDLDSTRQCNHGVIIGQFCAICPDGNAVLEEQNPHEYDFDDLDDDTELI